ncbi:MAG: DUF1002 domain-containing protein [Eubacterium sp.]|nr:DUF1002 domain-containing protein [Eubacterium sp.]
MNRLFKKVVALALGLSLAIGGISVGGPSSSAAVEVKPYIAFGASLKASEKNTVMKLFGISKEQLADYEVIEITNKEEHEYLDPYLAKNVIGTRALSSVKIEENGDNDGIKVTTKNINFCTEAMYVNALATAGFTDADVTVAGPFELSGTAALVGAIKAYSVMTGEEVNEQAADAAMDELVTTGELVDTLGSDKASQLIAIVKNAVLEGDLKSDEDILKAIDDGAAKLGVTLSDSDKQEILDLMKKIGSLDIDLDSLQKAAQSIYDSLGDIGIDLDDAGGFFSNIFSAIGDFFKGIGDWFAGLFS